MAGSLEVLVTDGMQLVTPPPKHDDRAAKGRSSI
jgi:hypothetical protein